MNLFQGIERDENKNQKPTKCCGIYFIKTMEMRTLTNTENKNSSVKYKQNILMLLSKFVVCGKKKSRFIKNHELH